MTCSLDHETNEFIRSTPFFDVAMERARQEQMWGRQDHTPGEWMLILTEEVGEFSQAVLDARFKSQDPQNIRDELVQVAAVALSMLECCDRNNWHVEQKTD